MIVSTRKLEYDAGSAEESIRSLMQAQHKAVLKDLKRGSFDDKIDSYLGGTPGLLPRGVDETAERPGEAELPPSMGRVAEVAVGAPTEQALPLMLDEPSAPVVIIENPPPRVAPPLPSVPRPAERPSASGLTAPLARGTPTIDTTLKTGVPAFELPHESEVSAEIEIQLVEEDIDEEPPRRPGRDTETQLSVDQTRPTQMDLEDTRPTQGFDGAPRPVPVADGKRAKSISDGIPVIRPSSPSIPPPIPPLAPDARRTSDRASPIHAAALPPARPISRPASRPAMGPPQVMSRPLPSDDRSRRESDPIEVYSPALPSAELPPGERPGQYAQHKKVSSRIPIDGIKNERSGGVPVPAGLGPPRRAGTVPNATRPGAAVPPMPPRESSPRTEPLRGRVPTPARLPVTSRSGAAAGAGVVMTRPAVIVGAPAKSPGTVPRIRKAREDEGRGFGQGLISEKSLDEVILAYLSEDADEK
ncbi:MAG: hypothetical protein E6J90_29315 [Deltaproteobacteria bacterium]|nr:MAG: hypothetical protein E6J90_29315 [Deltaproteobacteria bacterium]